jgi:gamma-glutamyltranspeptidase/glutathione hydrolase
MADYGMNPQAALDAPRWRFLSGKTVLLEQTVPPLIVQALLKQGHDVQVSTEGRHFGRGQIILRREGIFIAASEPRADGLAIAF